MLTTPTSFQSNVTLSAFVQPEPPVDLIHLILWPVLGGIILLVVIIILLYFVS